MGPCVTFTFSKLRTPDPDTALHSVMAHSQWRHENIFAQSIHGSKRSRGLKALFSRVAKDAGSPQLKIRTMCARISPNPFDTRNCLQERQLIISLFNWGHKKPPRVVEQSNRPSFETRVELPFFASRLLKCPPSLNKSSQQSQPTIATTSRGPSKWC